jgi:phosphatidylglycerophosphate synthase
MNYSYQDIVASRSPEKRKIDMMDIWVFIVVRPLSFVLTYLLMKLKVTANQATFLSFCLSIIGSILLATQSHTQTLVGLIVMNLWIVFDCVDGNIARTTGKSSLYGEFLDGISGYAYTSLLYLALATNVVIQNPINNWWVLILGAMTSIFTILPRLIEHKANNMFETYKRGITDKSTYSLFHVIGLNVAGMAGLSNPLMIVFFLLGSLKWYIVLYFFIHGGIAILSILKTIKNISKI